MSYRALPPKGESAFVSKLEPDRSAVTSVSKTWCIGVSCSLISVGPLSHRTGSLLRCRLLSLQQLECCSTLLHSPLVSAPHFPSFSSLILSSVLITSPPHLSIFPLVFSCNTAVPTLPSLTPCCSLHTAPNFLPPGVHPFSDSDTPTPGRSPSSPQREADSPVTSASVFKVSSLSTTWPSVSAYGGNFP